MDGLISLYPAFYAVQVNMVNDLVMGFKVYSVMGFNGEDNKELLLRKSDDVVPVESTSLEDAEVFMEGSIKWDGCINYHFPAQNDCMLHACGRGVIKDFDLIFSKLYDLALERMPNHEEYLK